MSTQAAHHPRTLHKVTQFPKQQGGIPPPSLPRIVSCIHNTAYVSQASSRGYGGLSAACPHLQEERNTRKPLLLHGPRAWLLHKDGESWVSLGIRPYFQETASTIPTLSIWNTNDLERGFYTGEERKKNSAQEKENNVVIKYNSAGTIQYKGSLLSPPTQPLRESANSPQPWHQCLHFRISSLELNTSLLITTLITENVFGFWQKAWQGWGAKEGAWDVLASNPLFWYYKWWHSPDCDGDVRGWYNGSKANTNLKTRLLGAGNRLCGL